MLAPGKNKKRKKEINTFMQTEFALQNKRGCYSVANDTVLVPYATAVTISLWRELQKMKKASVRHGLLRRLFFQSIFYVEGNWFCPISILEFVTRFAIFLVFSEQNNSLLFSSPWSKTLKPRIIATKQMGVFLMKMKKQRPNKWRTFAKRRLKQALLHCVWHYYFSNVDGFTNQCFFMF